VLKVTVEAPRGKRLPLDRLETTGALPSASAAVGIWKSTRAPAALVASTSRRTGTPLKKGGGEFWTVTVNVPLDTLPLASRALTVTGVVPSGNTVPLACE
jgi:hypothetical protein